MIVGLEIQSIAILLGGLSAYSIWQTLKEMSLANRASVSESLASQSFEILRYISDDPQLYEYFYKNKPLVDETPTRTKVLCCAEIMANFLEHIFLQRPSLPVASHDAWMRYVQDHYSASRVVSEFVTEHRYWYADAFLNFIEAVSLQRLRCATGRPETE
ncbi:MAG: hypothetical protein WCA20_07950 [Candidatus Sulfotelmatobacter sp.]